MVKSTEKEGSGLLGGWNAKCPHGEGTPSYLCLKQTHTTTLGEREGGKEGVGVERCG